MSGRLFSAVAAVGLCTTVVAAKTVPDNSDTETPGLYSQFDGRTIDFLEDCSQMLRLLNPDLDPEDEDLIRGGYCDGWLKAANDFQKALGKLGPQGVTELPGVACESGHMTYTDATGSLRKFAQNRPDLMPTPALFIYPQAIRESDSK